MEEEEGPPVWGFRLLDLVCLELEGERVWALACPKTLYGGSGGVAHTPWSSGEVRDSFPLFLTESPLPPAAAVIEES